MMSPGGVSPPAPDGREMPDPPTRRPPHRSRWFVWLVGLLLAFNFGSVLLVAHGAEPRVKVSFSPYFVRAVQAGKVASIASTGNTIQGTFKLPVRYPAQSPTATRTTLFSTEVPTFWDDNQLTALLESHHVEINASSPTKGRSVLGAVLLGFGPTLLLVGLFIVFTRRAARGGAAGALGNFGRSQARRVDPATIRVTFADVAGIDEAKAELTEIVDFLRNPGPYGRLGGRMPHGVLLSGAPGTGKTLLARAVAGEAHAALFSVSASEFIEAIVGVGAARVRDLFAKAREAACQRGRAARRAAPTSTRRATRPHRLTGEDPARSSPWNRAFPGRPRTDGLPRGRARARRDAHPRRGLGAQGLDHPARDGAGGHVVGTGRRPGLLHTRGSDRKAQGGCRGTGRGGDRLRNDHDRSRE
jgi:ATPase family protein associated with various cellular activities (AAA)